MAASGSAAPSDEIAVYDGRRYVGSYIELLSGTWRASSVDDHELGVYPTRKAAIDALLRRDERSASG